MAANETKPAGTQDSLKVGRQPRQEEVTVVTMSTNSKRELSPVLQEMVDQLEKDRVYEDYWTNPT